MYAMIFSSDRSRLDGCSIRRKIIAELDHLSYSSMSQWQTCGESWRLGRVEGLPDTVGWYHVGGTAVHLMTADEDLRRFNPDHPVKTFDDYFDDALAEQKLRSPSVDPKDYLTTGKGAAVENETWWRNAGPGLVAAWRRWLDNGPWTIWQMPDGTPAIELEMSVVVQGTRVDGFIDRILSLMVSPDLPDVIVDLKNGKPPKDPKQLGVYGLMMREQGFTIPFGGYFMNKGGILTGLNPLADLIDVVEYEVAQTATAIKADVFPARPSGLCKNWCGVAKWCYAGGYLTDKTYLPFPEVRS